MPNYQDGKIYTIRCRSDNELIYVGSTTQTLSRRMTTHRANSKITPNTKLYSKVNGNWADWYIELYEECPCTNKEILLKREGAIIREIGILNKEIAGRTSKEYYKDNTDKIALQNKLYCKNNTNKIGLRQKKRYEDNKENILSKQKIYREEHGLVKIQEYQDFNKERIKEYQKEYRLKNKDKAKEYMKEYQKEYQKKNAETIRDKIKI